MKTTYYQNNKNIKELMCKKFVHKLPIYLEVAVETEQSYKIIELANAQINAPGYSDNSFIRWPQ